MQFGDVHAKGFLVWRKGEGFLWLNRTGLMKKRRAPRGQDMVDGNTPAIVIGPK